MASYSCHVIGSSDYSDSHKETPEKHYPFLRNIELKTHARYPPKIKLSIRLIDLPSDPPGDHFS